MKTQKQSGVEYKFSADWTRKLESRKHWDYYWHQQKLMEGLIAPGEHDVLEVGVGSGFAANYMKSKGFSVTTLDIDEDKAPDIVANVVTYDFPRRYAAVLAFEILEHIPFEEFQRLVAKLPRIASRYAFVSLPRNVISLLELSIKVPKLREVRFRLPVKRRRIGTPAHHWEMDYGPYDVGRVEGVLQSGGMRIVRKLACRNIVFYALQISASQESHGVGQ